MNTLFLILSFLPFITLPVKPARILQEVKQGDIVTAKEVPHQVFLRLNKIYWCAGVIIDDIHVMTAASCLFKNFIIPLKESEVEVLVGTNSTSKDNDFSDVYNVYHINVHDDYVPSNKTDKSLLGDICILTLTSAIPFSNVVKPVKLPRADYHVSENTQLSVSGFGPIDPKKHIPTQRLIVQQFVISDEECKHFWSKFTPFTPDIMDERICTWSMPGYSACNGDNGSGLIDADGETLVAIHIYHGPCGDHAPNVFVEINHYLPWISYIRGSVLH